MYFFALSQAPPALAIISASIIPEEMDPDRRPVKHLDPTRKPTASGERIAYRPGRIISSTDDWVEMATHLSESASAVPSRRPGISLN
jgi:hypothetical protein